MTYESLERRSPLDKCQSEENNSLMIFPVEKVRRFSRPSANTADGNFPESLMSIMHFPVKRQLHRKQSSSPNKFASSSSLLHRRLFAFNTENYYTRLHPTGCILVVFGHVLHICHKQQQRVMKRKNPAFLLGFCSTGDGGRNIRV